MLGAKMDTCKSLSARWVFNVCTQQRAFDVSSFLEETGNTALSFLTSRLSLRTA
jgi:hypothetical protein